MKKENKIGTVFLASMLALAGLGVSYAGFSDIITVSGEAETGTVELELDPEGYSGTWVYKTADGGIETIYGNAPPETAPGELIAYSYAQAGTGEPEDPDVVMVFHNLFPCIDFEANFVIHYTGSIPAHVSLTDISIDPVLADLDRDWTYYKLIDEQWVEFNFWPIQMHYCDYVKIVLTIHVDQDDDLQGLEGELGFNVYAIQWYDCYGTLPGKTVLIPDKCSMYLNHPYEETGKSAYWKTTIKNFNPSGPPGTYYVEEGVSYLGWCIDFGTTINQKTWYDNVQMYSTYPGDATWLPGSLDATAWQRINYVINHKESSGGHPEWKCVTWAIWYFVNGGSHPTVGYEPKTYPGGVTAVENMIAGALNNPYYVPGTGEHVGVIMYVPDRQLTIIEVDP